MKYRGPFIHFSQDSEKNRFEKKFPIELLIFIDKFYSFLAMT